MLSLRPDAPPPSWKAPAPSTRKSSADRPIRYDKSQGRRRGCSQVRRLLHPLAPVSWFSIRPQPLERHPEKKSTEHQPPARKLPALLRVRLPREDFFSDQTSNLLIGFHLLRSRSFPPLGYLTTHSLFQAVRRSLQAASRFANIHQTTGKMRSETITYQFLRRS
jgi:hypothetical protein